MQHALEDPPAQQADHAGKLRTTMAAMRLSFTWFGTRKSLSSEQKAQAADTFHAEGKYISAGKKLIDTGDASFRAVTSVRTQATAYFKGMTLPFPEPGIRLVPQAALDQIDSRMQAFRSELAEAVDALDTRFHDLKYEARDELLLHYIQVATAPDATVIKVMEITWNGPHTPKATWRTVHELPPDATTDSIQRAEKQTLRDERFFRVYPLTAA